jgi:hypothetical protein
MTPRSGAAARIGVWIDSRRAVIAFAEGARAAGQGLTKISTDLEKQLRLPGGRRAKTSYGPQTAPPDDMRETSSKANLRLFFDDVAAALRGAGAIFIFGPGEAKEEFRKRLERIGLGGRIDAVESVGRMSDRQIAAKVRRHFPARV